MQYRWKRSFVIILHNNGENPELSTGEKIYLGNHDLVDYSYEFNSRVTIETSTDDKLLVINDNPFYTCNVCGYTKINRLNTLSGLIKEEHSRYNGYRCNNSELKKISLGHMFKTDVARIKIKNFTNLKVALSSLYALLEGISNALDIERRDIDGLIILDEIGNYNMIIYDNVPGGAGHVKRLKDSATVIQTLDSALNKVKQNCCEENTSCYNCIRNYYNQKHHKYLTRIDAINGINYMLEN